MLDIEIEKLLIHHTPNDIEFRLYYDTKGCIICYTCEQLEGDYIVIDALTYAEARHDLKVIDGAIVKTSDFITISKLIQSTKGKRCASEDVNIIVPDDYEGKTILWDTVTYEFRNN
jgi:hypothetical protein